MKIDELLIALDEALEQEFIAPFFDGFYDSLYTDSDDLEWDIWDDPHAIDDDIEEWVCENAELTQEYYEEVGKAYIEILQNNIKKVIPNFTAEYVETESPREYNYTTDKLVGKCDYPAIREDIKKYIEENKEAWKEWVKDNHSSYPGFISSYPDNADEWNLDNVDHNELGSILGFILSNEKMINDNWNLNDSVRENVYKQWEVDMDELNKAFNFNTPVEDLEELEYYKKEGDQYVYTKDVEGQQKLELGV